MFYSKWFTLLCFRELERKAKEEEERMIKLKEEELLKAKAASKKDIKDPTKKKSMTEAKEVHFPIPVQSVQHLIHVTSHS